MIDGRDLERKKVFLAGATGTIGKAVAHALVEVGHEVVCLVRPNADTSFLPDAVTIRESALDDLNNPKEIDFPDEAFDSVISCIASRTGVKQDAWAVEYDANLKLLRQAERIGVNQFILLSAICVQKPTLAFQQAKLAFEAELRKSSLDWVIIRPTAFFKSLSGQIERVKAGKPFMAFGDGTLTACKPISDRDLANYMVKALHEPKLQNKVLPIGGPGPAITALDQADMLSELLGKPVPVRKIPPSLLMTISNVLGAFAFLSPKLRAKSELAKIGHYYATESMLVWDAKAEQYDADATPEFGSDHLFDHYRRLISGEEEVTDLGAQTIFSKV